MEKFTISRDDAVYEAFADVVKTAGGVLVCTYRESDSHVMSAAPGRAFSRIIVRRSLDGGLHWGPRQVICATEDLHQGPGYNCSRLLACRDGALLLIVDRYPPIRPGENGYDERRIIMAGSVTNILFRSRDDGATWQGPQETSITRGIVPSIKELANGDLLVGVTELTAESERQLVYRSADRGRTWSAPVAVPFEGDLALNEGDFVELDDGTIVMYMREDRQGLTGWKSVSRDGGRTWQTAVRSRMMCCRGRPCARRLSSGEILVTYRFSLPNSSSPRSLMMFVETPEQAASGDDLAVPMRGGQLQRFLMLDVDRGLVSDTGYSGWVELDGGRILVVNYINDDAPRAFIRGYVVDRRDWTLSPPGSLAWVGKGEGDAHAQAIALSAEAYRKHRQRGELR